MSKPLIEVPERIVYCADVIARYGDRIVLIERLGRIRGLALPGGRQDPGETLTTTATREFREETNLDLIIECVLGMRGEAGRDPRGRNISCIFLGTAHGHPHGNPGESEVILFDLKTFKEHKHRFAFDHASILKEYWNLLLS